MKNNRLQHLLLLIIFTASLFGCERNYNENSKTKLYLNWIYSGAFTGEIVGSDKYAKKYDISIQLEPGGVGLDPLKLVKDFDFGIASSDEILRAIDKGQDLVIIGVVNENHPAAFVALKENNIKAPSDFVGKRIGILPFGSTGLIYKAMVETLNLNSDTWEEVTVTPDLRPFISGSLNDVQPIFIFDETVTLEEQNLEYDLIMPSDYGVNYKGAAYFTTSKTYDENPVLVEKFLNTMKDGWNFASNNPAKAIEIVSKVSPDINEDRELIVLEKAIPYYINNNEEFLLSDSESWKEWMKLLVKHNVISSKLNTQDFLKLDIAEKITK